MKAKILLGIFFVFALASFVSAVECNYDKDCWDSHNNSCYYICQDNKCAQIQTFAALPPYPYCHCGSAGCNWQDWRENSNECFEKCKKCDYVKCPNAFFNETTMACECGEFGGCTTDYVPVCGLVQVQCIAAPCNPIYQTFGNRCELDRAKATFVHDGECSLNETTNKCDLIGLRKDEKFCSADKFLEDQIKDNGKCENNFECKSNVCVSSQCVSEGLLQKILNWFRRLFG